MKILHYNCPAGICGDMNLGAMVDLGVDPDALKTELQKLNLKDWEISFSPDKRKGVSGTRCDVKCPHEHHHRTFADIRKIIEASGLKPNVKSDAIELFRVLAEAEGAVHDMPADKVHFHEVGAVDSIIDMVGAAICWDILGVDEISASTIELGSGTVKCAHGRMPVPAPATARLVENFPVSLGGTSGEATTPTGAALLAGKSCRFGNAVAGRQTANGVGVGQRDDPGIANVLYAAILETEQPSDTEEVLEIATNLDDMSPERIAFLGEKVMEAGALDTWQTPATFKKGRLGCVFSVLIQPKDKEAIIELLLCHSTTLGLRFRTWTRRILERTEETRETRLGKVRLKTAFLNGRPLKSKIEYDDLRRLANEHNLPISEVEKQLDL